MSYSIHADAEAELGDAAVYYATHASGMIALAFLAEYERVRDLLIENQQREPRGEDGLCAYHFDRFPYTVVYEEDDVNGPQIFAIAHRVANPDTGMTESELLIAQREQRKLLALIGKLEGDKLFDYNAERYCKLKLWPPARFT